MSRGDAAARIDPAGLWARIQSRPTLKRLIPNTGWLLADRLIRMAVSLIVGVWVARYLGPGDYGRYSFAIAFASLFSAFGTLGLDRIAVRELVTRPEERLTILGSAYLMRLAGGVAGCALAVGSLALIRPGDGEMLSMVALMSGVMVVQALDVIDYLNQARMHARVTVVAMSAAFVLTAAARVTLIVTRAPLTAFAWVWAAELGLGSLGLAVSYRLREGSLFQWRVARERLTALLRDGWPLMLSGVLVLIYTRVDQVMLGQMSTARELGVYAAAVRLVEAWYFIPTVIAVSAFPAIVEARRTSEELFRQRLQKLYDLMAMFGYAVALPAALLSPWIVRILFGPDYAGAAPMLAVLIWSLVFTNLGVVRGLFLSTMNWTWAYFMTVAAGCIVNVVLNLLLIPRLGGMGAVIASCAAYWMATHGSCFLYRPLFPTGAMLTRALWPWRR